MRRKLHTAAFERLVRKLKRSHRRINPYAVATTVFKHHGMKIFRKRRK